MTDELLIVAGPTAVGKSAIALALAERHALSILSADSMQVYRGQQIGTAQPNADDRRRAPHFLVGHVDPGEEYHVARFVEEANEVLAREAAAGRRVLIAGGTGLFLKHLREGIFAGAPRQPEVRARIEADLARLGAGVLWERLRAVDPTRAAEVSPNDSLRIVRALEVFETTGVPMSEHHARDREQRIVRPARYVVLDRSREELARRIAKRIDTMLEAGWLDEARRLMALGLPDTAQACKALGYRELFRVLRGEWDIATAREGIVLQTTRFAKRQLTWFRAVKDAQWVSLDNRSNESAIAEVERLLGLG